MIIVRAPFRLPLGGGGTDLPSYYREHEGFLITAAINKYMFININKPAVIDKIILNYTKTEIVKVDEIELIEHDIVREVLKHLKIDHPLEIGSMADFSAGTGMGSSGAYTVALLSGLNALKRRFISIPELADEACKVEMELIGKPVGKQDQYVASFGGILQLEIDKSGSVTVTPLHLDPEIIYEMENRFLMFYTDIERDANEILAEQGEKISKWIVDPRGLITPGGAVSSMHRLKEIGFEVKESLMKGDIDRFGAMLHEHWMTKKSISDKMSNPEIDRWYNLAKENGALGGKIMGAGGGGFFLFCTASGKRKELRKVLENAGLKYVDFRFDFEGVKVLANL